MSTYYGIKRHEYYVHCWKCLRPPKVGPYQAFSDEGRRFEWTLFALTYTHRSGVVQILATKCSECG